MPPLYPVLFSRHPTGCPCCDRRLHVEQSTLLSIISSRVKGSFSSWGSENRSASSQKNVSKMFWCCFLDVVFFIGSEFLLLWLRHHITCSFSTLSRSFLSLSSLLVWSDLPHLAGCSVQHYAPSLSCAIQQAMCFNCFWVRWCFGGDFWSQAGLSGFLCVQPLVGKCFEMAC